MGNFIGVDRRGLTIVFPQHRWDHAIERGHFDRIKGVYHIVMQAFEQSSLIIDNEPLDGMGTERVASERYVSFVEPWSEYLVVPVVVRAVPVTLSDGQKLDPPVRIAQTAYSTPDIPRGEVLWKWPPDPK